MEENEHTMETVEFSLADVVHDAIAHVADSARQWPANVIRIIDPSLPATVVSDPRLLRQMVVGLLSAALRLSGNFSVKLSIFAAGFRNEELDLNFEATAENDLMDERQVLASLDNPSAGGELTLLRSRRLLQLIGGDLGVHSDTGRVTFWCRIPVQAKPVPHPRPAPRSAPISERPAVKGGPKANVRVLMAEDNLINQRVGKLILERAGYKIDLVADGREALEAHRQKHYDVILMDCQMPIMDGFEATRVIRSLPAPQPVIIAVTANALVGERERCLFAGMDDYLSKPFQAEQLVSIVDKWVTASGIED